MFFMENHGGCVIFRAVKVKKNGRVCHGTTEQSLMAARFPA